MSILDSITGVSICSIMLSLLILFFEYIDGHTLQPVQSFSCIDIIGKPYINKSYEIFYFNSDTFWSFEVLFL